MNRLSNAEIYDRHFVPALFGPWGKVVSREAQIRVGHQVLDVACGTGALSCAAAEIVGQSGQVTGLDISEEMLSVARNKQVRVNWQQGRAESLPFKDNSFDAVGSQFGYMFFEDPPKSLSEMLRVLRPGGRLAVAVCDAIDHSPGYAVLTELLHRLFGSQVADGFRAPFRCGDPEILHRDARSAGIDDARVTRHPGKVRFPSIASLVSTERSCAWTLGGMLEDTQFEQLLAQAELSLQPFVDAAGQIVFDMPVLIMHVKT